MYATHTQTSQTRRKISLKKPNPSPETKLSALNNLLRILLNSQHVEGLFLFVSSSQWDTQRTYYAANT